MDSKPLLQDRPPAYSPTGQAGAGFECGPNSYGSIPAPQHGFHPPLPYTYPTGPAAGYALPPGPLPHNYPNTTYTIIQQPPTTSVVVVGGCPACSHITWQPSGTYTGKKRNSWCIGRHFHLSWCALCHCIFSYWNSLLSCTEATKMS
ncbi:membrane protein BRI3 isoform X1 [Rhineura floridana]|uniref:membrane protein BRI3 isoform X1 n=1 Tax=Rhineura floridana TaxID=261503 RepID=UPI002AC86761|nr:membrane protein BRI3 isoform X1 [Rhineura floridana]